MYSPDAKFEENRFDFSRDILDWLLYCSSDNTNDVITLLKKRSYLLNRKKDILKRKMPFYILKGLSNKQKLYKD